MMKVIVRRNGEVLSLECDNASVNAHEAGVFLQGRKVLEKVPELEKLGFKPSVQGLVVQIDAESLFCYA